jgi:hypothetical protein
MTTSMRWTGKFLIVLALSSLGCARGDWISETQTLVDVTGTWEGPFRNLSFERTMRWVLQQKGAKVRGEVQGLDGTSLGSVEGLVNGEVFSWNVTGPFVFSPIWYLPNRSWHGEATVNSDELNGRAAGPYCPCTVFLHRVESGAIGGDAIKGMETR